MIILMGVVECERGLLNKGDETQDLNKIKNLK
jgi:hypothetical protein